MRALLDSVITRLLFASDAKREANSYIWNTIAGLINAAESVILNFFVVRTSGLEDAGILSLAFAIGNLMMTIGKYSVRVFQVTDRKEFRFQSFFTTRVITVLLMLVASCVYLAVCARTRHYEFRKSFIIFGICFIYMVESMEDVFLGLYHQQGYLDVASKIFSYRWILTIGSMLLVLLIQRDTVRALAVGMAVTAAMSLLLVAGSFPRFGQRLELVFDRNCLSILKKCFPLFAVGFLSFYVTNSPKYAIDKFMSEDVQACYGFIATPVFAIELLSSFLYQPVLVPMTNEWQAREYRKFNRRIYKQLAVILLITVGSIVLASVWGIPVLSMVFSCDLTDYRTPFIVLLVGGGALAVVMFYCVMMTIVRKQAIIMYCYAGAGLIAALFSNMAVKQWGVMGGSALYTGILLVLAVVFFIIFKIICRSAERNYI